MALSSGIAHILDGATTTVGANRITLGGFKRSMVNNRFRREPAATLSGEVWPHTAAQVTSKHQTAFFISDVQLSRTVAKFIHMDAGFLEHTQKHIRHRGPLGVFQMPATF